jgi:hypothetical protein
MGHYSDAYERDDERLAQARAVERKKKKSKIEHDLKLLGTAEVLLRIQEGRY